MDSAALLSRLRLLVALVVAAASLTLACGPSSAATTWATRGPYGGIADTIVADPTTPTTLYEASRGGGVFKSTDRGAHWVRASTGLTEPLVRTLVIDPTHPQILYAAGGNGVFRSTDGAAHWTQAAFLVNVLQIAINPKTPTTLYAVVSQGPLYRSTNSGTTWTSLFNALQSQSLYGVVIDPVTPANVYVGAQGGVWRTANNGTSWTLSSSGFGTGFIIVQSLFIDPRTPRILYANAGDGLKRSANSGISWAAVPGVPSSSFVLLAVDPTLTNRLYGSNLNITGSTYQSTNSGSTFVRLPGLTPDFAGNIRTMMVDPGTSARIYAGTDHGVFASGNSGQSWLESNTGLANTLVTSLAIDPTTPTTIYAGTEYGGLFRTTNGGIGWNRVANDWIDKISSVQVNPTTPSTLYYASAFGNGVFKSTDSARTWTNPLQFTTVLSFALDRTTPTTLYAGTGGGSSSLLRSTNSGTTFRDARNGLPPAGTLQAGSLSADDGIATLTDQVNGIYNSINAGVSWAADDPPAPSSARAAAPAGQELNFADGIVVGQHLGAAIVYAGLTKLFGSSAALGATKTLYKKSSSSAAVSGSAYTSWAAPTGVTAANCPPINALAADPTTPTTFYAGGLCGVLKGTNQGATLAAVGKGLPTNMQVDALVVTPDGTTIYAGVFGGGVYKLTP